MHINQELKTLRFLNVAKLVNYYFSIKTTKTFFDYSIETLNICFLLKN